MSAPPLTVAGGTVAALVAAGAAARAGRDVELLLPRKGVGGGFAPLELGGQRLERGIRLLELHYEGVDGPVPALADYRPDWSAHRPYITLIADWLRDLVGDALVEVDAPRMVFRGRHWPEALFICDLSRLRDTLGDDADTVAREARAAWDAAGSDAGVLDPARADELWTRTLTETSIESHGATFHELLIAPISRKIRPEGADDVLAALRRKLWMPLFWPKTLWEAASGAPLSFVAQRPQHTVSPGTTGEIVARLVGRLEAHERVRITRIEGVTALAPTADGAVRISCPDGLEVVARRPVLGLAPGELFAAAGVTYTPDRVHSVLSWAAADEDDVLDLPSMLHVIDADVRLFRFTAGERDPATGRRILTLELDHNVAKEDAPAAGRAALERLGIVREGAPLTELASFAGPTFTAPTAVNLQRFRAALDAYLSRGIDAEVVGGALAFGADPLNEQIVQGLRAAKLANA